MIEVVLILATQNTLERTDFSGNFFQFDQIYVKQRLGFRSLLIFPFSSISELLGSESRTLCMLDKHSSTELHNLSFK